MNSYLLLISYTQQGIQDIKGSPGRYDAFKSLCEQSGGRVKDLYLAMGRYDLVAILEMPDDAGLAKVILATASKGGVRTETLRLFPENEFRSIIASLP